MPRAFNLVQNDAAVAGIDLGAGVLAQPATIFGLTAYLLDNVDDNGSAPTEAEAIAMAAAILVRVAGGLALTLADINTIIVAETTAGIDLDGTDGGSDSTGTVEEVLRVVTGESYRLDADVAYTGAGGAFLIARAGVFTTAANQIRAFATGAGGRKSTGTNTVVQSGDIDQTETDPARNMNADVVLDTPATADLAHREIRIMVDTPDLHRSVLLGAASILVNTAYAFQNPSFTYGAGGTATAVDGTALGTDFQGRAMVVYKATGEVI
jgi:hypothetical protein